MSEEVLYRKVMKGKRTVYELVTAEEKEEQYVEYHNLTDAQCLTVAGALGVTLLMLYRRNMKQHQKAFRLIENVEKAILALYHKSGEKIDDELADLFCKVWDKTMTSISRGVDV